LANQQRRACIAADGDAVAAKDVQALRDSADPEGGAQDARRFPIEPGWRVGKSRLPPTDQVSPDRGGALSFGYFSLGAIKEK
jgi:hypothetical protein